MPMSCATAGGHEALRTPAVLTATRSANTLNCSNRVLTRLLQGIVSPRITVHLSLLTSFGMASPSMDAFQQFIVARQLCGQRAGAIAHFRKQCVGLSY